MNILYICHRFPYPPKRGGKIRPFNMIKHMSEQGHRVTVASLVRSDQEANEGKGLEDFCHQTIIGKVRSWVAWPHMVALLPTFKTSSNAYFYSSVLKHRIKETLNKNSYDLIFVHCSSVAQYVEDVEDIPKILDFGDMDSQKWLIYSKIRPFPLSLGYLIEGTKLQRVEKELANKFDMCTCTTKAELDTLESYDANSDTDWFPNGVDTDFFHLSKKSYDPNTICFVGRMDYYPNQQAVLKFCKTTLPLLQTNRPQVRFLIVGAAPSQSILRLGKLKGVTVTGTVPDVRPYVHNAVATIAPLKVARGTQNKILESMAMGVPTIISKEASGGIDAVAGEHVITASTPGDYCNAILKLMENPDERTRLSHAGRKRVISHHNWAGSMKKLDQIIENCLSKRNTKKGVGS